MKKIINDVAVLIPCIEEDKNLSFLLPKIKKVLHNYRYEIIVIGSKFKKDNSELISKNNLVNFIRRKDNDNYGQAIRAGLKVSKSKKIIVMDADGSHDPNFLVNLLNFSNSYDLVIASRYVEGGNTENNFFLIFLSKILNICYSILLNISIKDISNSFRCYDAKIIKNLKLNCNHFDILEEILFKIIKNNKSVKIIELPFSFKKRKYGKSKRNLFLAIVYFVTLIKIKFS
jgi:dolichol-phosphate mannosyltransferase